MDEKAKDLGPAADPVPDPVSESVSGSVPDPDDGVAARSKSADRLVSRLAELRAQVEVLAAPNQDRGREAVEQIRQAQERVATLELMLVRAREREDSLTVQTVRDQAAIADSEARIAELSTIAARAAEIEAARREEAAAAAEDRRRLTLAQTEAEARQAEIVRLRSRCSELETDLSTLGGEVAAAAVARAVASRTERERNEARDRAYTERRLAAEDRRRAAEANLRATELQSQLRSAERRIVQLTNERSASQEQPEAPPKVLELNGTEARTEARTEASTEAPTKAPTEAPWTTLQRASSAAAGSPAAAGPPGSVAPPPSDATHREPAGETDVIDLTEEEASPIEQDRTNGTAGLEDVPVATGSSHTRGIGLLARVLRGRHHDPDTGAT